MNGAVGYDVNNDGDVVDALTNLSIVYGFDSTIPPNTTVSFSYIVTISGTNFNAGDEIKNVAMACGDLDGDTNYANDPCAPSNEVVVVYPQFAATEIHDTGTLAANATNDGGDDVIIDAQLPLPSNGEVAGTHGGENITTDATGGDIQFAYQANAGEVVEFLVTVQNDGNGTDTFQLELFNDIGAVFNGHADTGPLQTYLTALGLTVADLGLTSDTAIAFKDTNGDLSNAAFSFWDASGTTRLIDSDGDGKPDTGPVVAAAAKTVMVKVQLSADYTDTLFNAASVLTTSQFDGSVTDTAVIMLGKIVGPAVDLENVKPDGVTLADHDGALPAAVSYTNGDAPVLTVDDDYWFDGVVGDAAVGETTSILPGMTVTFPLQITNNGGTPDAFQLSAGSTGDTDPTTALGTLYSGWSVQFKDAACEFGVLGTPAAGDRKPLLTGGGNVITTTPAISGNSSMAVCAYVTISSSMTEALGHSGLGTDGNGDLDDDYPIFFRVVSDNSGAADVKLDAVDVNDVEDVSCSPSNANQVQPGGSVDYPHTIRNDGNTTEVFYLDGTNSLSAAGFANSIMVTADANGGVHTDAILTDWSLLAGDGTEEIKIRDANGADKWVVSSKATYTTPTPDEVYVQVSLLPGESMDVTVRVFAPSGAANGTLDVLSLNGEYNMADGATPVATAPEVVCQDSTTVILGQVRLTKMVALDSNCDGTPDLSLVPADAEFYEVNTTATAEPGQCVTWQIVGTNQGDAQVKSVVIYDQQPAFTTYLPGSLKSCVGDFGVDQDDVAGTACTLQALTDSDNTEAGSHFGQAVATGDVTFFVDDDAAAGIAATATTGGSLESGAKVTVRFTTKVD